MSAIRGYPSQQKLDRTTIQFVTVEPVHKEQNGASVVAHQYVYEVGTDAAEAGSTFGKIVATGHLCVEGDVIRFTSGVHNSKEIKVVSIVGNDINLAEDLSAAVGVGDTFQILRHKYPLVEEDGRVRISGSFTTSEQAVAEPGDPLSTDVKVIGGNDSGTTRAIAVDAAGNLQVDVLSNILPTGAATSAAQTDGSQKTQIVDGSGNVISSTANALDVNLKSPISIDVSLSDANDSILTYGFDGSVNRKLKTDANGELQVDVLSSALPSGAATEFTLNQAKTSLDALAASINATNNTPTITKVLVPGYVNAASSAVYPVQGDSFNRLRVGSAVTDTTGTQAATVASGRLSVDGSGVTQPISSADLTAINGKLGSLGQKAMAASAPVVIASDQTAIPVSGTITTTNDANGTPGSAIPSEATMVAGSDGTNLRALKTDASGELQIDVLSSALPTGAATSAIQTDGTQKTQIVDAAGDVVDIKALNVALVGTDKGIITSSTIHGLSTAGGGTYVDVKVNPSGALTVEADITSSALPTGAATETTLATLATEATASAISGKLPATLGQKTMANSMAVVIASDQGAIPVTGSFSAGAFSVVDLLDSNLLDVGAVNIPGSFASPVQVVASLAADVKAMQILDTTGGFIGLYTGGSGSEVLKLVIGPGSDQTIEHAIPSGTRVSLKRLDSTVALSSGYLAINFLG